MSGYFARQIPKHCGPAAWSIILGRQSAFPSLESHITADFVVVGAGFAGLSAARRLTQLQPGAKIVLLEAGRIAEGASGRNSGFMIDLPHELSSDDYAGQKLDDDRLIIKLNRQAIDFASSAVDHYKINRNYFDPMGKVNGAASETAHKNNISYAVHLNSLGENSEMLDQKQMKALTGSNHYLSGLYTPGTAMLQPAGYIRGLAEGLHETVKIFENSPVTAFERQGQNWNVKTPQGTVSTGRVILANNGHLESFGFEQGKLMQLFLYGSMTPELDKEALSKLGGQPRWGVTPSDPMGTTMRRIDTGLGGNRIITRTCATLNPDMLPLQKDVDRAAKVQQQKFDQRFPKLAGMKMEYRWAGHLCLSLNSVSVMRELEDGLFSGCVQNGLGTARGTLTGIGAAELACGVKSDITRYFTSEDSPKKMPPKILAKMGANILLRWKEWRARDE